MSLAPTATATTLPLKSSAHDATYYAKCMVGGALACGLTHTALTPIDVSKCNVKRKPSIHPHNSSLTSSIVLPHLQMQVDPKRYTSLLTTARLLHAQGGARNLFKGWLPTLAGYSMQGTFKYGLYEIFKDRYTSLLSPETAHRHQELIWCAASASAEVVADVALCPLEMVKVRMQTTEGFPTTMRAALPAMKGSGFPFGAIGPLWGRQIPYTVAMFWSFEKCVDLVYSKLLTDRPKDQYAKTTQLGVTFAAGYAAGILCAVVSHPADSVVSLMTKSGNKGKGVLQIAREAGFVNLITKGLSTRIVMIGTLTGLQWWIYDAFKTAAGLATTGGGH
ncbi:Cu/Pi carrier [Thoreauomyces humboldtii]|nr:Cu/Pi carrier [Thoreauomyces humboldtii]